MSKKKWAADPEAHKKMAIDAGLIYATEETCTRCHQEEGNKNFKPFKWEEKRPLFCYLFQDSIGLNYVRAKVLTDTQRRSGRGAIRSIASTSNLSRER